MVFGPTCAGVRLLVDTVQMCQQFRHFVAFMAVHQYYNYAESQISKEVTRSDTLACSARLSNQPINIALHLSVVAALCMKQYKISVMRTLPSFWVKGFALHLKHSRVCCTYEGLLASATYKMKQVMSLLHNCRQTFTRQKRKS